jgi:hypothetical protein
MGASATAALAMKYIFICDLKCDSFSS